MAELAHFQNFVKLKDTSIEFNDITVLAGKPGTGKSYVMKFIYGINESYKKALDDASFIEKQHKKYKEQLNEIIKKAKEKKLLEKNFESLDSQKELIEFLTLSIEAANLDKETKKLQKESNQYVDLNEDNFNQKVISNVIKAIFGSFSQISNYFDIQYQSLHIINEDEELKVQSNSEGREVSSNIFVETPLILELHKHMDRREAKTPYHIESLLNILDEDYSFTNEEEDKLIKDFSQKVNNIIGGDIKNRDGSFVFSKNNDKDYNIFNASSGTKSIGLLQYLVTNKALKKGSILFWEEPEVHLHPEWQKKMIELFLELMDAGVKIVFSTHSPYMCEYLNALSKNRELTNRVSFNLLQEDNGVVENVILKDSENWDLIQSELLDPLEEIAWEYL